MNSEKCVGLLQTSSCSKKKKKKAPNLEHNDAIRYLVNLYDSV